VHFQNNNRGCNGGKDFELSLLEQIYEHIQSNEIKMDKNNVYANASKSGYMVKQGGRIKTWKRRWFVLNDGCLYYFKAKGDSEPLGIIPLENLQVNKTDSKKKKILF